MTITPAQKFGVLERPASASDVPIGLSPRSTVRWWTSPVKGERGAGRAKPLATIGLATAIPLS